MPSRCSQSSSGLFSNATTSAPTSRSQILWTLAFMVGQLGAIDEYEVAAVDGDRPATARVDNVWAADVDTIAHVVAEIVDNDSPAFVAGARIDTDAAAHRKVGQRGGVGYRIDIFDISVIQDRPSFNQRAR